MLLQPPPKPIMGSTIEALAVLPKANRVDAQVHGNGCFGSVFSWVKCYIIMPQNPAR